MSAISLHVVEDGNPHAPPLLLFGSLGSSTQMWDPQVPVLSARFRVMRVDLRGHGASPVPAGPYSLDDLVDDVEQVLSRLEVQRVDVAGLSLGGMVAMRLAARRPERVRRLALLCTSAYLPPAEEWRQRAEVVRADGTAGVADAVVGRWLTPQGAAAAPELVNQLLEMVRSTPAEGYAACCEAIADMDLRDQLGSIAAPTLLIAGAQDPATPPEHLQAVQQALGQAELLVLDGAAHLANMEQPEAVNAALVRHFTGRPVNDDDRVEQGMQVRRAVLGDAHVDRAIAATSAFTASFQDFITRTAWGDVWSRPGLSRRERSIATLAALTALSHDDEVAMHVRAALRNGLSREEIGEVLLHTGVYAGVPAANRAFARAASVLEEIDRETP
jgi:3-oxoadipate enol-lactonase/4-carboxymuconolactone decarboxylase